MFSRAATLLCALLLAGCQNAPNQLSLYAPFGEQKVPPPNLTRANAVPYYSQPTDNKTNPAAPATASAANKELSHYDPYRGIMIPGNFTPAPVLARSTETWGSGTNDLAATPPRERPSTEEPIRIVESSNTPTTINAIASQNTGFRSNGVKFNASPPSGVVKPGATLIASPAKPKTITAVEVARLPKPTTTTATPAVVSPTTTVSPPAFINPTSAPLTNPLTAPPALLPTPSGLTPSATPSTLPVTPKPAGGNRVSLWSDPGDGSRVMPAAHVQEVPKATGDAGSWRAKQ